MELGVFNEAREEWIQFDEDTEVLVRFIPKERLKELTEKAGKQARRGGVSAWSVQQLLTAKEAIRGWRKIKDHNHPGFMTPPPDSKPIPFNEENLTMLMQKSYEFEAFVGEYATNAKLFLELEKERQKGNSGSSPAGSTGQASL